MTNDRKGRALRMTSDTLVLRQIDEACAWELVRAARNLPINATGMMPLAGPGPNGGAIELAASGNWRTRQKVSSDAARLFDIYLPYIANGKARTVLAQMGQSLDGHIATENGHSHHVTGQPGLEHLHRLRALCDVVIVGAGTAISDDPRLTVRRVDGANPVRAVIDARGRVPFDRQLYRDGAAPTLVLTTQETHLTRRWPRDVEPVVVPDEDGHLSPDAIVDALSNRGLNRILVEGGGVTISHFLQAGVLDRFHVCVSPLIIGSGVPAVTMPPVAHLKDALRFPCRHHSMGDDILFDLDLG